MDTQTGEASTWERLNSLPHRVRGGGGGVLSRWGPAARQGPGLRFSLTSVLSCLVLNPPIQAWSGLRAGTPWAGQPVSSHRPPGPVGFCLLATTQGQWSLKESSLAASGQAYLGGAGGERGSSLSRGGKT